MFTGVVFEPRIKKVTAKEILTAEEFEIYMGIMDDIRESFSKNANGYFYEHHIDLRPLGSGCSRVVYPLSNRYVLKVEKTRRGQKCTCNEAEFMFYRKYKDSPSGQHLAKVIFLSSDSRLLIMERLTETVGRVTNCDRTNLTYVKYEEVVEDLRFSTEIEDTHSGNFMIDKDGTIKSVDYGFCGSLHIKRQWFLEGDKRGSLTRW